MECPKCKRIIDDNASVCPYCKKVLLLECPNCHALGESSVCEKCGYTILVKCSKCSRINPVKKEFCTKCGLPTKTSLAYQECESDEFASITVSFQNLVKIRKTLKSQELYQKFYIKLKNILLAQTKNVDCKYIIYGEKSVINLNKELSFPTSANKAVRLALKIVNTLLELNTKITEEFGFPLGLTLTITKKSAEDLQEFTETETRVKPLVIKKNSKKYLNGLQIVLDEYVRDEIYKDYKTDSLYTHEENGQTLMFYEVILDSYVLPPQKPEENAAVNAVLQNIKRPQTDIREDDKPRFKIFDINAKCHFEQTNSANVIEKINSIEPQNRKILSVRGKNGVEADIHGLLDYYRSAGKKVLYVNCSQEMNFKPWGFFEKIFREYFNLEFCNEFIDLASVNQNLQKRFKPLFDFIHSKPVAAATPEDARFTYMDLWGNFFSLLDETVIVAESFENIDDTAIQTLELYFDKFRNIKPEFVFVTGEDISLHSKLKNLLRTDCYTEISLQSAKAENLLSTLKSDAGDLINSFYYEKLKASGSYLYFKVALEYLKETGVLVDFENRLIVNDKKSIVIHQDIKGLYKALFKYLGKNPEVSFILAYTAVLGGRTDFKTLELLGVKDVEKNTKTLVKSGVAYTNGNIINLYNQNIVIDVIRSSLKKEAESFIYKNILAKLGKHLDTGSLAITLGHLEIHNEQYLTLWKNSAFAIATGDYDAYLKNCLGFLSLVDIIGTKIEKSKIDEHKIDVYNNILICLYNYSPAKIYYIENILLMDAIEASDDERIVKLSNLMLQGALISSNYTDALALLHNILSRMKDPTLMTDGKINTKFLLLSLVNIEILYNIGDFHECVNVADKILSVLSPEVIEEIKPPSFSINLFATHIAEIMRLAAFAKLYMTNVDIELFFEKIKIALGTELPDKDCILAIKDYLAGRTYLTGNVEEYSPFSKMLLLILKEISSLKNNYKEFAQNIYQAKLLAMDLHQRETELFCDLLIGYAYFRAGQTVKASSIFNDVISTAESSAIFNILVVAKYFAAILETETGEVSKGLILINDSLAVISRYNNEARILYALLEKLYIDVAQKNEISSIDIETESQKIQPLTESLKRILAPEEI